MPDATNRPDWTPELRARLAGVDADPARLDDIVLELEQHLEDRYDELIEDGLDADAARASALGELASPHVLRRALGMVERPAAPPPRVLGAPARGGWLLGLWGDVRDGGAGPAGEPRPDRGGAPHAGRRHRRQRRDLQRRQRGAAAAAAVRGSRSPRRLLGLGAEAGAAGRGLGGRVVRALPRPRPGAAAGRRLRRIPVHDHERHRRGRAHPRRRRHRELLRDARAIADPRPRLHVRRRGPAQRARRDPRLRPVAAPLRRRSEDRRQDHPGRGRPGDDRRGDAAGLRLPEPRRGVDSARDRADVDRLLVLPRHRPPRARRHAGGGRPRDGVADRRLLARAQGAARAGPEGEGSRGDRDRPAARPYPRRRRPRAAADPAVRGRHRAPDRLCERRQPAAGARQRPHPRDRAPRLPRRQPVAHRPPAVRREPAARDRRIDPRARARRVELARARAAGRRAAPARQGRAARSLGAAVHGGRDGRDRGALRRRPRPARRAHRPARRRARRLAGDAQRGRPPAGGRVRGGAVRPVGGAAGRGGAAAAQPRRAAVRGSRLPAGGRARGPGVDPVAGRAAGPQSGARAGVLCAARRARGRAARRAARRPLVDGAVQRRRGGAGLRHQGARAGTG